MNESIKSCLGCLSYMFGALLTIVILFILLLKCSERTPPPDHVFVGYLEIYAGDVLPSCKVIRTKYLEGHYECVVYRLNKADFQMVLIGVQSSKYLDESRTFDFSHEAMEMLRKEKIYNGAGLTHWYNLSDGMLRMGFREPDLIIYDRTLEPAGLFL